MSRFVFRFAALLRLRCQARDEAQRRVGEAMAAIEKVRQMQIDLRERSRSERNAIGGEVVIARMLDVSRYAMQIEQQIRTLDGQLEQLRQELERRQAAARDAEREVRRLEKLRERRRLEFQTEQAVRQQQALDEFANLRWQPPQL